MAAATDDEVGVRIDLVAGGKVGGRQTSFREELIAVSQATELLPPRPLRAPATLSVVADCKSV